MGKYEELEKIEKLKADGILTDEEFEIEKQKILGSDIIQADNEIISKNNAETNKSPEENEKKISQGTVVNTRKKLRVCSNCGNQLEEGEKFCGKCGKKVNNNSKWLIIAGIVLIIIIIVFVAYKKQVIMQGTSSSTEVITENDDSNVNTVYTSFNGNVRTMKNVFDEYLEDSEDKITELKSTEWRTSQQTISPYYNFAYKIFYKTYESNEIAMISLFYDDDGNVLNIKFTSLNIIGDATLALKYGAYADEWYCILKSMPYLLKYATGDENLSENLTEKIEESNKTGSWGYNELKQGIKFSMGMDNSGYFCLEMCLEQYIT